MNETKRPVGAPRGNTNALKHGIYSSRFAIASEPPSDSSDPDSPEEPGILDLSDEITLIRHYIARVVELTPPDETLDSARETLRLLCLSSIAISRLVRAQYLVHGDQDLEAFREVVGRVGAEIRQEIAARPDTPFEPDPGTLQIRKELGLVDPHKPDDDPGSGQAPDPAPSSPSQHPNPFAYPLKIGPPPGAPPASSFLSPPEPEPSTRIDDEFTNPSR